MFRLDILEQKRTYKKVKDKIKCILSNWYTDVKLWGQL